VRFWSCAIVDAACDIVCRSCYFLSLRWRRKGSIVTKNASFFLFFFIFLPLIILGLLSHRNLRSLFFPGNKRDRLENLTQYAQWMVTIRDHSSVTVLGNLTYFSGGFSSANIRAKASNSLQQQGIYSSRGHDVFSPSKNPHMSNADHEFLFVRIRNPLI